MHQSPVLVFRWAEGGLLTGVGGGCLVRTSRLAVALVARVCDRIGPSRSAVSLPAEWRLFDATQA